MGLHNHNLCECQSGFDYAFYTELINAHRMPRFYPLLNTFCSEEWNRDARSGLIVVFGVTSSNTAAKRNGPIGAKFKGSADSYWEHYKMQHLQGSKFGREFQSEERRPTTQANKQPKKS